MPCKPSSSIIHVSRDVIEQFVVSFEPCFTQPNDTGFTNTLVKTVCEIYQAPNGNWEEFIADFTNIIQSIGGTCAPAYILGDFNINLLKYPTCT